METLIKITINTKGFQDVIETQIIGDTVYVWHTYNGDDYCIGQFNSELIETETIESFINEFIENFYDLEQIEII